MPWIRTLFRRGYWSKASSLESSIRAASWLLSLAFLSCSISVAWVLTYTSSSSTLASCSLSRTAKSATASLTADITISLQASLFCSWLITRRAMSAGDSDFFWRHFDKAMNQGLNENQRNNTNSTGVTVRELVCYTWTPLTDDGSIMAWNREVSYKI